MRYNTKGSPITTQLFCFSFLSHSLATFPYFPVSLSLFFFSLCPSSSLSLLLLLLLFLPHLLASYSSPPSLPPPALCQMERVRMSISTLKSKQGYGLVHVCVCDERKGEKEMKRNIRNKREKKGEICWERGGATTHQNHGQLPDEKSYYWFAGCLTGSSYALIHTCAHIHKRPLMWEHAHTHTSATHTATFFTSISSPFTYSIFICFALNWTSPHLALSDLLIILFSALALQF